MIFKIKYNFVILELIGQPYFDLKQNNCKNVWNKCFISCFRINSLSSTLRDKTTHLSMQHCFHVIFYIIGTQYLHIRHPGKDIKVIQNLYLRVIFQIIIKRDAHAQYSKSLFIMIFLLFLNQCYSNKLYKHQKKNTKNNFW